MSCIASLHLRKRLYKPNPRHPPRWTEPWPRLLSADVSFSRSAARLWSVANLVWPRNISVHGAMALLFTRWLFFRDLGDLPQPLGRGVDGHQEQRDWEHFLHWLGSIPPPFCRGEVPWARIEGHPKTFSSLKIRWQKCKHISVAQPRAAIPTSAPIYIYLDANSSHWTNEVTQAFN